MQRAFDGRRILAELLDSQDRTVHYFEQYSAADIRRIQLGILFVMAWWSGSSRRAFAKLKEVIQFVDPNGRLELVIVDTDGCPELYQLPGFGSNMAGNGETAWIKEGEIVSTSGLGFQPNCFEPNTRALLAMAER